MKEIKLFYGGLGRYDNTAPFILGDLELYISGLPAVNGDFRFLAWINKKSLGSFTITRESPKVTIPHDDLEAGTFTCRVDHYNGSELVHHYEIEGLTIKDVDREFYAVPEIAALTAKTEELTEKTEALDKSLTETKEAVAALENALKTANKNILALILFAFGVQKEVPYLDGLDLKQFIKTNDFELTDEEIEALGGVEE